MKVEVTHLKAPWPAGASVGSVVELAAAILPSWAAGKCVVLGADDERAAEFAWEPPARQAPAEFVVNPASEADRKAAEAAALLESQALQLADLSAQLQDAQQALGTARAEIASLVAERDAAAAKSAPAPAKAAKKAPAA